MNYLRMIAGVFVGVGALYLIHLGELVAGAGLLGSLCGFFVGDYNGQRTASKNKGKG